MMITIYFFEASSDDMYKIENGSIDYILSMESLLPEIRDLIIIKLSAIDVNDATQDKALSVAHDLIALSATCKLLNDDATKHIKLMMRTYAIKYASVVINYNDHWTAVTQHGIYPGIALDMSVSLFSLLTDNRVYLYAYTLVFPDTAKAMNTDIIEKYYNLCEKSTIIKSDISDFQKVINHILYLAK